jgi:KaiC/GvpD/RAD55 family RecA-like ATPase
MKEANTVEAVDRLPIGIPGLDRICGGGFVRGAIYLFMGRPGTGKTTMGNQLCFAHARHGGRAVYLTLLADLVITDYKMPRMDGFQLCAHLLEDPRFSSIPILMASASYGIQKSIPREVVGFIHKPIHFPVLLSKIREVLDRRGTDHSR